MKKRGEEKIGILCAMKRTKKISCFIGHFVVLLHMKFQAIDKLGDKKLDKILTCALVWTE